MTTTTVTYRGMQVEAINFNQPKKDGKAKIEQCNTYVVYDSMGRRTEIYIIASNIHEACKEAKKRETEIGSSCYKVKRSYNGGVRG